MGTHDDRFNESITIARIILVAVAVAASGLLTTCAAQLGSTLEHDLPTPVTVLVGDSADAVAHVGGR